ncbi:MAG: hypothetical protein WCD21_03905 [Streptomyces sp.]
MIVARGEQAGRSFGAAKLADLPPPTGHGVLPNSPACAIGSQILVHFVSAGRLRMNPAPLTRLLATDHLGWRGD